jgi:hypothetical protein
VSGLESCKAGAESILRAAEQDAGDAAGDERAEGEENEVVDDEADVGAFEVDEAEGAAEMREREKFRDEADVRGKLVQRGECAREREHGQQEKDGELDGLCLRVAEG